MYRFIFCYKIPPRIVVIGIDDISACVQKLNYIAVSIIDIMIAHSR